MKRIVCLLARTMFLGCGDAANQENALLTPKGTITGGARTLFLLSCYAAVAASPVAAFAEEKLTFVLMKVGRLDATLQNAHGKDTALYAIGLNGARRQRLPLAWGEEGRLEIHLDTASLEHGPTAFFELTVD